ncbi:Glycosyl hydrolase family 10 [Phytophthora infestans]|uniref:endo-1,4-beta-xylanase n=1 Tax=Phytophthora infestans TaxID=4787 RepID=A0A8S9UHK5_PHYIN|nr:Glycosyl hydrolase family 10 [Phytophthora infestans]
MTHFGDSCHAWDVANEVMATTPRTASLFGTLKRSLGLKTKLYYNDYNTNTVNAKSTAVLEMIQTLLLDKNIGIDGMGFQSHSSYSDTATAKDMVTNLERFTALGLEVAYTELDVKTSSPTPSEDEQEQQVQVYTNVISACQQGESSLLLLDGEHPRRPRTRRVVVLRTRASRARVVWRRSLRRLLAAPPTPRATLQISSSQTEASRGSDSATQTASSDAQTANPGDAETTADGDAAASATENSDETSSTSSNTPTSPTERSCNAETTAQKPTAGKSGACTRLLRK